LGDWKRDCRSRTLVDSALAGREAASRFVARAGLAAVFLLHRVAGFGEVGDDAMGAALDDAHAGRDITQPRAPGS
jgi:hypothetical protein